MLEAFGLNPISLSSLKVPGTGTCVPTLLILLIFVEQFREETDAFFHAQMSTLSPFFCMYCPCSPEVFLSPISSTDQLLINLSKCNPCINYLKKLRGQMCGRVF